MSSQSVPSHCLVSKRCAHTGCVAISPSTTSYTIKSETFHFKNTLFSFQVPVVVGSQKPSKYKQFHISDLTDVTHLHNLKFKQTASQVNYNLLSQARDF